MRLRTIPTLLHQAKPSLQHFEGSITKRSELPLQDHKTSTIKVVNTVFVLSSICDRLDFDTRFCMRNCISIFIDRLFHPVSAKVLRLFLQQIHSKSAAIFMHQLAHPTISLFLFYFFLHFCLYLKCKCYAIHTYTHLHTHTPIAHPFSIIQNCFCISFVVFVFFPMCSDCIQLVSFLLLSIFLTLLLLFALFRSAF